MKFPQIPPDWRLTMDQVIQDGRAHDFFQFSQAESLRTDSYPHRDDFRQPTGTKGHLTADQQWAAIRMGRAFRSQPIPLCDLQGKPFTFFLTQRAFEILHEIDLHCGGGIGVAQDGIVQKDTRDRYYIDSITEEALTSSQLEGAVVTRSEAREMIRRQRPPATEHERMVMNNYRTMRLLSELKEEELTPSLVLRIHREVTAGTLQDPGDEGQFRKADADVRMEDEESGEVFHTPPPAGLLAERVAQLCDFANEPGMNGFLHPVIRSILHTETDGNDLNYFIHHQLEIIRASILSLQEYIGRKQAEVETLRRHLGADSDFNYRQLALLKHALKHPFAAYTVVSHQSSHAISNQTAKNDLVSLESKGLLQRGKVGKAFVYRPVPDLAGKLEA